MNDKELLELAAKAANVNGEYVENQALNGAYRTGIYDRLTEKEWNPLESNGDAFMLMIKLGIVPIVENFTVSIDIFGAKFFSEKFTDHKNKPCTATRRSIVRAAAEIGKTK